MTEQEKAAEKQIAEILFSSPDGNLTPEQHRQIADLTDHICVPDFRDRAERARERNTPEWQAVVREVRARAGIKEEVPLGERARNFLRSVTHR